MARCPRTAVAIRPQYTTPVRTRVVHNSPPARVWAGLETLD